jgi:hypothetical protein
MPLFDVGVAKSSFSGWHGIVGSRAIHFVEPREPGTPARAPCCAKLHKTQLNPNQQNRVN